TDAAIAHAELTAAAPAQALATAERAIARAGELGADQLLPWLYRLSGAALVDLDRPQQAAVVLARALELTETHGRFERGFVLAELAETARRGGDTELARSYATRSEEAFDELGFVGSSRYPRSRPAPS
ncbi:MAG TPA: hypothetical protein VFN19_04145, partial [Candidatus Nanopelagicales bacterium]|nr:hypothetical protein [Candidatus Nanopelagicales bacterium]